MNSLNKHIILFLMFCMGIIVVSCSPSVNENEEWDSNETYEQLKGIRNFETDSLSVVRLKAFEQRAIQKLQDLKDYFEILSDPQIDTTFKNHAIEMALELFASKENTVAFRLDEQLENPAQKVDSFFTSLKNSTYGKLSLKIHNITLINKIEKLGDSEYEGAIKFRLFVLTKQKTYKMDLQCAIIVKRVQKKFGNDSKMVWEVYLGDIFLMP